MLDKLRKDHSIFEEHGKKLKHTHITRWNEHMGGVFNVSQLLINLNFTMSFSQKLQQKHECVCALEVFVLFVAFVFASALTLHFALSRAHAHRHIQLAGFVFPGHHLFSLLIATRAFTLDRFKRFVKLAFKTFVNVQVDFNQKVRYSCNLNYTIILYARMYVCEYTSIVDSGNPMAINLPVENSCHKFHRKTLSQLINNEIN